MRFGDSLLDEWFLVHVLLQRVSRIPCLVRVWDDDGEFLLIEAADHLPPWADPDTCDGRVGRPPPLPFVWLDP